MVTLHTAAPHGLPFTWLRARVHTHCVTYPTHHYRLRSTVWLLLVRCHTGYCRSAYLWTHYLWFPVTVLHARSTVLVAAPHTLPTHAVYTTFGCWFTHICLVHAHVTVTRSGSGLPVMPRLVYRFPTHCLPHVAVGYRSDYRSAVVPRLRLLVLRYVLTRLPHLRTLHRYLVPRYTLRLPVGLRIRTTTIVTTVPLYTPHFTRCGYRYALHTRCCYRTPHFADYGSYTVRLRLPVTPAVYPAGSTHGCRTVAVWLRFARGTPLHARSHHTAVWFTLRFAVYARFWLLVLCTGCARSRFAVTYRTTPFVVAARVSLRSAGLLWFVRLHARTAFVCTLPRVRLPYRTFTHHTFAFTLPLRLRSYPPLPVHTAHHTPSHVHDAVAVACHGSDCSATTFPDLRSLRVFVYTRSTLPFWFTRCYCYAPRTVTVVYRFAPVTLPGSVGSPRWLPLRYAVTHVPTRFAWLRCCLRTVVRRLGWLPHTPLPRLHTRVYYIHVLCLRLYLGCRCLVVTRLRFVWFSSSYRSYHSCRAYLPTLHGSAVNRAHTHTVPQLLRHHLPHTTTVRLRCVALPRGWVPVLYPIATAHTYVSLHTFYTHFGLLRYPVTHTRLHLYCPCHLVLPHFGHTLRLPLPTVTFYVGYRSTTCRFPFWLPGSPFAQLFVAHRGYRSFFATAVDLVLHLPTAIPVLRFIYTCRLRTVGFTTRVLLVALDTRLRRLRARGCPAVAYDAPVVRTTCRFVTHRFRLVPVPVCYYHYAPVRSGSVLGCVTRTVYTTHTVWFAHLVVYYTFFFYTVATGCACVLVHGCSRTLPRTPGCRLHLRTVPRLYRFAVGLYHVPHVCHATVTPAVGSLRVRMPVTLPHCVTRNAHHRRGCYRLVRVTLPHAYTFLTRFHALPFTCRVAHTHADFAVCYIPVAVCYTTTVVRVTIYGYACRSRLPHGYAFTHLRFAAFCGLVIYLFHIHTLRYRLRIPTFGFCRFTAVCCYTVCYTLLLQLRTLRLVTRRVYLPCSYSLHIYLRTHVAVAVLGCGSLIRGCAVRACSSALTHSLHTCRLHTFWLRFTVVHRGLPGCGYCGLPVCGSACGSPVMPVLQFCRLLPITPATRVHRTPLPHNVTHVLPVTHCSTFTVGYVYTRSSCRRFCSSSSCTRLRLQVGFYIPLPYRAVYRSFTAGSLLPPLRCTVGSVRFTFYLRCGYHCLLVGYSCCTATPALSVYTF